MTAPTWRIRGLAANFAARFFKAIVDVATLLMNRVE
jgi:hypothetical protein